LGADGLESVIRLTADGVPVLSLDARIGGRLRRRRIATVARADLPAGFVSLGDLYREIDLSITALSLILADTDAFEPVLSAARDAGQGAEERLWLGSADFDVLVSWRQRTTARLVNTRPLSDLDGGPERWAARLREGGIDGLSLPHREWSGGLVTLLHRFDRYAIAQGAVHERELAAVVNAGIDAVSSRHVDRMSAVVDLYYPTAS
jgi:glycerophosphoryl diester phosphodiesterase